MFYVVKTGQLMFFFICCQKILLCPTDMRMWGKTKKPVDIFIIIVRIQTSLLEVNDFANIITVRMSIIFVFIFCVSQIIMMTNNFMIFNQIFINKCFIFWMHRILMFFFLTKISRYNNIKKYNFIHINLFDRSKATFIIINLLYSIDDSCHYKIMSLTHANIYTTNCFAWMSWNYIVFHLGESHDY